MVRALRPSAAALSVAALLAGVCALPQAAAEPDTGADAHEEAAASPPRPIGETGQAAQEALDAATEQATDLYQGAAESAVEAVGQAKRDARDAADAVGDLFRRD